VNAGGGNRSKAAIGAPARPSNLWPNIRALRSELSMTLERLLAPNINDDWRIHLRRAWQDFDYVLAHG
jgi:hypothetical protein